MSSKEEIYGPHGKDSDGTTLNAIAVELFNENLNKILDFIVKKIGECKDNQTLEKIEKIIQVG